MGKIHNVRQGECLWKIARRYKIPWKTIWNHGQNRPLRNKRGNPNILCPGDKLFIPDQKPKEVSGDTEKKHKFRLPGNHSVRVIICDFWHQPKSGIKYHFVVNGEPGETRETEADGAAFERLPNDVENLVLVLPWGKISILLGTLDPANTTTGMQQRLANLGFDPGPIDGVIGPKTLRAIREFQEIEHLEVTGQVDRNTIRQLRQVHEAELLSDQEELEVSAPEASEECITGESVLRSVADEMEDVY